VRDRARLAGDTTAAVNAYSSRALAAQQRTAAVHTQTDELRQQVAAVRKRATSDAQYTHSTQRGLPAVVQHVPA
jgi:hypothetical protein